MEITEDSRSFISCWNDARNGDVVPRSDRVKIERFDFLAPRIMYFDWDLEGRLMTLFSGSLVNQGYDRDLTGGEFITPDQGAVRQLSYELLHLVTDFPCGVWSRLTLEVANRAPRRIDFIYLPVEHGGECRRILASVEVLGVDFRLDELNPSSRVIRHPETTFIDLGKGTPIQNYTKVATLEELLPLK